MGGEPFLHLIADEGYAAVRAEFRLHQATACIQVRTDGTIKIRLKERLPGIQINNYIGSPHMVLAAPAALSGAFGTERCGAGTFNDLMELGFA
jgi:hypothetical protein